MTGEVRPNHRYDAAIVEASVHNHQATAADAPLSTLRGASVTVDARRAGRVAAVLCVVALAATTIILAVAGVDKNDQITELRATGVPVTVTVSRCLGLLGGSGSNAAGFACRGSYRFDGRRYEEAIPGNVNRAPGSTVRGVIAPGDPGLLSTPGQVGAEEASWRVFIAPTVLGLLAVATTVLLGLRTIRRRRSRTA